MWTVVALMCLEKLAGVIGNAGTAARSAATASPQGRRPSVDDDPAVQIRSSAGADDEAAPLIGVEGLEPPKWASVDAQVAAASVWRTVRSLPAAAGVVVRLAWATSRRLTVLAGLVHVASGCATAFGLSPP